MIKRIGIDIDGTIADYKTAAFAFLYEKFGPMEPTSPNAYDFRDMFGFTKDSPQVKALRQAQKEEFLYTIPRLEADNYFLTSELRDFCNDSLDKRVRVYFITARDNHPQVRKATENWLDRNTNYYDDVFHTDKKAELCQYLGIDIMLEDSPSQLMTLLPLNIPLIVPTHSWTEEFKQSLAPEAETRVRFASNWREMLLGVKEFLGEN